jgi:hypothetical protein
MSRRSTRHGRRDLEVDFSRLDGGIDYSVPAHQLPPNKLYEATNLFYDIDSGRLMTRPGLVKLTTIAADDELVAGGVFTVQGTRYHILASKTKLYRLSQGTDFFGSGTFGSGSFGDASGSDAEQAIFVLIGSLNGTEIPQFATFNGNLYIANGGKLQKWNGSALSNVTAAPTTSSLVVVKSARLFVNSGSEPDIIKASGIMDDTTFGLPGGATFQAGWTDGDGVIAMMPLGDDLVVVKGNKSKSVMVLKGVYPDWFMQEIARGTGVVGKYGLTRVGSQLIGLDVDGINLAQTVEAYGDFKLDPVGGPVVGPLTRQLDSTGVLANWPEQAMVLVFPNNNLSVAYALHYAQATQGQTFKWTRFTFAVPRISFAFFDAEDSVLHLCSKNGHVYTMERDIVASATVFQDDGTDYEQILRTKVVDPSGAEVLLKRATFMFEPLSGGTGEFKVFKDDGTVPNVKTDFTISPLVIADWLSPVIGELDAPPIGMPESSTVVRIKDRTRQRNIQMGVVVNSGGLSISRMDIDAAAVGRD